MATDLDLLGRYRRGDATAMDALVDRHGETVYAFVRRYIGARSGVDDLTQEVWLRVLRHAHRFDGRSRFTTWLFTVTRNTCIDHLRRLNRRPVRPATESGDPFQLDEVRAPGPGVFDRVARRELSALVEEAVGGLPDAQREVFLLREHTGMTFEEIGVALSTSRDTVKSRMRYALGHIRRQIHIRLRQEVQTRGL